MARTRDIRTNQIDIACDVCGRTLLRGEHAETFLAGGSRREVCDLCTARAQNEGWIRESGGDELALRHTRHDGRGLPYYWIAFARRKGIDYRVHQPHERIVRPKSYAENFIRRH